LAIFFKEKNQQTPLKPPRKYFSKSNKNNSTSKRYSFFLVSASEELSQSRSQETNGQAKYEDGFGTALVF